MDIEEFSIKITYFILYLSLLVVEHIYLSLGVLISEFL